MSSRSQKRRQQSDPSPEATRPDEASDPELERHGPENGATAEESAETGIATATEEPAQVQLTIKGSDRSARAAAKRFGEGAAKSLPGVATPAADTEPPDDDPIATLLSDGRNMVLVTRQKPRTVSAPDGTDVVTNVRIPGKYECPTSIQEIEEMVFEQHGGSKYKCTIHPDTADGANKTPLGHFTINHPDPKCPPFISGVTVDLPQEPTEEDNIPTRGDPTLRETDNLADVKARLARRLDRAQTMKEIREMEKLAKAAEQDLELDGKPPAPQAPSGESDEVRKLREENERLRREAEAKKNDDRFAAMQNSIADLAKSVAALAAGGGKPHGGEESLAIKMLTQSQQHSKDMLELVKNTSSKPAVSGEGDFDKFLDRMAKLNAITGGGPNKGRGLSQLEEKLIDMSFERLTGGGDDVGGGDGEDDVAKLAIKEFAPIAKTFVEKKMNEAEAASGGSPLTPEQLKKIQLEAAQAAAKKVQEDLALQGLGLATGQDGRLIAVHIQKSTKPVVTPRQLGSRVVSETRTSGGVVKKVAIEPANLSERPKPAAEPPSAPAEEAKGEENVPKCGVFPMLGPNGSELKIPFPVRPGDMKYDRKYAVDFVLDGIRSEIRQGFPQKSETDKRIESYVIGDAIEYLDDEILDQLDGVDTGAKLEALLGPWGEASKIAEIKKAGDDEVVASYLRKLVLSIQREWQREKGAPKS